MVKLNKTKGDFDSINIYDNEFDIDDNKDLIRNEENKEIDIK
jgi:hypothetical protein